MAGTLHIFRRNDSPLEYQANYNLGPASWVQVFPPRELEDFLRLGTGLDALTVDSILGELQQSGHVTEAPVLIAESHLAEMGFAESPSDEG
jgi:hypothetical protein